MPPLTNQGRTTEMDAEQGGSATAAGRAIGVAWLLIAGLTLAACGDSGSDMPSSEDADRDGYPVPEDCDDTRSDVHPAGVEVCGDGVDQDCDGEDQPCSPIDADGDGTSPAEGDCDDDDPNVHPGAEEVPYDGVDQDCDVSTPDDDLDGDGFRRRGGGDCDDDDASVYPGAEEIPYDGVDQDCSGSDLVDVDRDGVPGGDSGEDCDDIRPDIRPGAPDVCEDGVDQDCDGRDRPCPTASGGELPGLEVEILEVTDASGGAVDPGDRLSVRFRLATEAGDEVLLTEVDYAAAFVSGPAESYQRVIAPTEAILTESTRTADGDYVYAFPEPLPETYLPPYNDTDSFGADDGELQGEPLRAGTYTLAIEAYLDHPDGRRDVGNGVFDFPIDTDTVEPREVVTTAACNRCHGTLSAHDGLREDVRLCVMCHTAGSEDRNVSDVAGGTPGVTVELGVLTHRIHNGAHLPSVLGVTTDDTGARDFSATPDPYRVVGAGDVVHDYSDRSTGVWPNHDWPMPGDEGTAALSAAQQDVDEMIRQGLTACALCHGDPDGDGPLDPPSQGERATTAPSRAACGSCHDDVVWTSPYSENGETMPPQPDDSECAGCHTDVAPDHLHPLRDPSLNPGLKLEILSVTEGPWGDGDGTFDPGERVQVELDIRDRAGDPVDPATLQDMRVVLTGPTDNPSLVLETLVSSTDPAFEGDPPYTLSLPETVEYEHLGTATGAEQAVYVARPPLRQSSSGPELSVWEVRSAFDNATTDADVPWGSRILELSSPVFGRDDYVAIEPGTGSVEYARVAQADGSRIWLDRTLKRPHPAGANVEQVSLIPLARGSDYTTDPGTGAITLSSGALLSGSRIVASYDADFVVPTRYAVPFNDSPDVGASQGDWGGLPLLSGTYRLTAWVRQPGGVTVDEPWGSYPYKAVSPAATRSLLFGAAGAVEPTRRVSGSKCNGCHVEVRYHGGNRLGVDSCIACHAVAGAEDWGVWREGIFGVPGGAPTPGVTVDFRTMLHKVHRGRRLPDASTYEVAGFSGFPQAYDGLFPGPGRTARCVACHDASDDRWLEPPRRRHPDQSEPTREWAAACTSCHSGGATSDHASGHTRDGIELCGDCHAPGREMSVSRAHAARRAR